ncbi:hypothetical protein QVH35_09170 [Candidatus Nitrosotenuis chungbukensis]|uniref:hypothetical protein n=1 Tax=Candidatus Nitrosotenuis chungbukensis TaxID=1353246 RepID=UPI0005B2E32A|nr:hypothetical protein [Candidatus Nitrosotenuis chungbukensis]WKT57526.1 hypothetical protein QVH35_09170 [Candidatus Nitrosotenuis chungbukensis]
MYIFQKKFIGIIIAVVIVAVLSPTLYDYVVWRAPLESLEVFPILDPCDVNCKTELEKAGNTCMQTKEGFVCVEPRIIRHPESDVHGRFITPIDYGGYFFIKNTENVRLQGIKDLEIIDQDTVRITFSDVDSDGDMNPDSDFEYTANIQKGKSFVGECFMNRNLHVYTFTDVFELDGIQYAEFIKRLAFIPDGMECNTPQIIKHSIGTSVDNFPVPP